MNEKTVRTPNVSCHHCAATIRRELAELAGVLAVEVDVDARLVTVRWQPPATWDEIAALLAEIGYPPEA